jgi:hypothetical protein
MTPSSKRPRSIEFDAEAEIGMTNAQATVKSAARCLGFVTIGRRFPAQPAPQ